MPSGLSDLDKASNVMLTTGITKAVINNFVNSNGVRSSMIVCAQNPIS